MDMLLAAAGVRQVEKAPANSPFITSLPVQDDTREGGRLIPGFPSLEIANHTHAGALREIAKAFQVQLC